MVLAQLSFLSFAQQHRKFRKSFAKVPERATLAHNLSGSAHTTPRPNPHASALRMRPHSANLALIVAQHERCLNVISEGCHLLISEHTLEERKDALTRCRVRSNCENDLCSISHDGPRHRNFRATFGLSRPHRNFRKNFPESLVQAKSRVLRTHGF